MATPNHSIVPVTASDVPALTDFLHSCKQSLTINRLLFDDWPNDAAQKPLYKNAVEGGLESTSVECLKIVDPDSGEIVAYLAVARQLPTTVTTNKTANDTLPSEKPTTPYGVNPRVLAAVSHAVARIAQPVEGLDHFEISYIAVQSTCRRKGMASQLVQICFDKAKAAGIPLVVSAEPASYDFFIKLGFRDTTHADMDLSQWAPAYSGFGIFRLSGMMWSPEDESVIT